MDGPDKHTFEFSEKRRSLLEALLRDQGTRTPAAGSRTIPRRTDPGPALLSFAQERLWFLDRFQPGNSFYNVSAALRFSGTLDVPALTASLTEIVRRHDALRTTFTVRAGQPVQCIAPAQPVTLPLTDLQHLPEEQRQSEAQRLATAEAQRPFDLEQGPLLRLGLLRPAAGEHVLLITKHHSVTDGWSLGVFVRELGTLYPVLAAGRPSPLPQLPLQYADYAVWQRQWLQGEVLERQLGYWKERLRGVPILALPTDRPRPVRAAFPRGGGELCCTKGVKRCGAGVVPAGGRDAVHGAAGGVCGAVAAPERSGRYRRGHAAGQPPADGAGGVDRLFRQYGGAAQRPVGQPCLP
jgi:hypothetical protein